MTVRLVQLAQAHGLDAALLAVTALTVLVRLPGIARPLLGNFATKNVIYAMIARNWASGVSSPWQPTLDCLAGDGPALHMLEFPAAAYATGWLWRCCGGSLDVWGRATSIVFSAIATALLYWLARRWHDRRTAIAAGVAFALSPVGILCGQSFMLEASLVCFSLAAVAATVRWADALTPDCARNEPGRPAKGPDDAAGGRFRRFTSSTVRNGHGWLALAAAALALALVTKIYMAVLVIPLAAIVGPTWSATTTRQRLALVGALSLAVLPCAVWYWHAAATAAVESALADRVFYSVRDSALVHRPPHPLLVSPAFYAHTARDLATVVLTPVGLALALIGLGRATTGALGWWLAAGALLILALPAKFEQLNYYYVPVLPPLCLAVALGWRRLAALLCERKAVLAAIVVCGALLSARYAIRPAFVTPVEDRAVLPAARAVQQLTPANEPVLAVHGSTLDLLYYTGRKGWFAAPGDPRFEEIVEHARQNGARYLALVDTNAGNQIAWARGLAGVDAVPVARGEGFAILWIGGDGLDGRLAARRR